MTSLTQAEQLADAVKDRLAQEQPATRYVAPSELQLVAHSISQMAAGIFDHASDSDQPEALAALGMDLRDALQGLREAFERVEIAYVSCAGEKLLEVEGVGPVEILKRKKRTEWRNEDLWKDVVLTCQQSDRDPLEALAACARPSWRVTALRELDLEPSDYCLEVDDGWSVKWPSRKLEDRF